MARRTEFAVKSADWPTLMMLRAHLDCVFDGVREVESLRVQGPLRETHRQDARLGRDAREAFDIAGTTGRDAGGMRARDVVARPRRRGGARDPAGC